MSIAKYINFLDPKCFDILYESAMSSSEKHRSMKLSFVDSKEARSPDNRKCITAMHVPFCGSYRMEYLRGFVFPVLEKHLKDSPIDVDTATKFIALTCLYPIQAFHFFSSPNVTAEIEEVLGPNSTKDFEHVDRHAQAILDIPEDVCADIAMIIRAPYCRNELVNEWFIPMDRFAERKLHAAEIFYLALDFNLALACKIMTCLMKDQTMPGITSSPHAAIRALVRTVECKRFEEQIKYYQRRISSSKQKRKDMKLVHALFQASEQCFERYVQAFTAPLHLLEETFLESQEKIRNGDDCCLCLDEKATIRFQPCGHVVMCKDCSKLWSETCPVCRESVDIAENAFEFKITCDISEDIRSIQAAWDFSIGKAVTHRKKKNKNKNHKKKRGAFVSERPALMVMNWSR